MPGRQGYRAGMRTDSPWPFWRVARVVASAIVLMAAAYFLVVAFDNITNPTNPSGSNWPFVKGVLGGQGTPADNGFEWRFIDQTWFGVLAPGATPRDIVTRLHAEIAAILQQPEMRERLTADGMTVVASTPDQFAAFLKSETAKYARVVQAAGIKAQ